MNGPEIVTLLGALTAFVTALTALLHSINTRKQLPPGSTSPAGTSQGGPLSQLPPRQ